MWSCKNLFHAEAQSSQSAEQSRPVNARILDTTFLEPRIIGWVIITPTRVAR